VLRPAMTLEEECYRLSRKKGERQEIAVAKRPEKNEPTIDRHTGGRSRGEQTKDEDQT
jgi:hypothetical protein